MSTFSALAARCATRFHDSTNMLVSTNTWVDYLLDTNADVVNASPWWPFHDVEATLVYDAGAANEDLPADTLRVDAVFNDTDNIVLRQILGDVEVLEMFPDPANNLGTPTYYRIYANKIELHPRPSVATTLRLFTVKGTTTLTGSDEPPFPEQFHSILIPGALARAYEDDDNPEAAALHWSRFMEGLEQMKNTLLVPQTESYPSIEDRWE
jgi:hypothetical protein